MVSIKSARRHKTVWGYRDRIGLGITFAVVALIWIGICKLVTL